MSGTTTVLPRRPDRAELLLDMAGDEDEGNGQRRAVGGGRRRAQGDGDGERWAAAATSAARGTKLGILDTRGSELGIVADCIFTHNPPLNVLFK